MASSTLAIAILLTSLSWRSPGALRFLRKRASTLAWPPRAKRFALSSASLLLMTELRAFLPTGGRHYRRYALTPTACSLSRHQGGVQPGLAGALLPDQKSQ